MKVVVMLWILISFISLIIACLFADWNRKHQYEVFALNFWRTLVAAISLSPICFFGNWPSDTSFYVISAFIGVVSGTSAMTAFHLAAKFNGRISVLFSAVSIILTFTIWTLIDPESRQNFTENPFKSGVIILLILSAAISLIFMRNKDKAMPEKGYLLPVIFMGFLSTTITITGKVTLPNEATQALGTQVLIMGLIIFIVQAIMSFCIVCYRNSKGIGTGFNTKKHIKCKVLYFGLIGSSGCVVSWASIALAPNPAYVDAILMSAPILMLAYHKIMKIEDKANPVAGTILTVSVISLILVQQLIP